VRDGSVLSGTAVSTPPVLANKKAQRTPAALAMRAQLKGYTTALKHEVAELRTVQVDQYQHVTGAIGVLVEAVVRHFQHIELDASS